MSMPRVPRLSRLRRPLRIAVGVTLTALALAYILLKVDIPKTWDVLTAASPWWFLLAVGIMIAIESANHHGLASRRVSTTSPRSTFHTR